ncbi:MAG: hypothetical protein Q4D62_13680 [Planctomycetia bacterium]|nr:hypothetical protein [Planctomycetia bacterium]
MRDVAFHPEEDFLIVVDQKETLTLTRPQSDGKWEVTDAWKVSNLRNIRDVSASPGDEAVWIFSASALGEDVPFLGDTMRDGRGREWIVSEIQHLTRIGCWKCRGINMALRYGLDSWVDWYSPQWRLDESGVPVPEYRLRQPGIAARIVPEKEKWEEETSIVQSTIQARGVQVRNGKKRVRIFFQPSHLKIGFRDCLVTPDNRGFRVREYQPASSWKELSYVIAEEFRHES